MKKFRRLMTIISFIFLCAFLTSCLEVKQAININSDGSGDARLEVAVMAAEMIPKLKSEMPKDWNIIEEKEKEGKHIIVFGRKFKEISELNDNEATYSFSSERKGFLKKSYTLEIKQLKSSDMPFPYEFTVKMPGAIDETDGTKLSSSEVKWNLEGFRRGKELSVKSSGFAMPDFASLKESFNKVFNSILYREEIVFLRDGNLWVMDGDGKNQKQLTNEMPEGDEGVIINTFGNFAVSTEGKIVYDRIRQYSDEGNIYLISLKDGSAKKITDSDDTYSPSFSPEGDKIAVAKIKKDDNQFLLTNMTQGSGIWIIDLKTGQQTKLIDILPQSFMPRENIRNWSDAHISWLRNGKYLSFQRIFWFSEPPFSKSITYLVSAEDGHVIWNGEDMSVIDSRGKMVLLRHYPDSYLYLLNIETKKMVQLSTGNDAVFLPTSKKIIFFVENRNRDSNNFSSNIYITDLNNREILRITEGFAPTLNSAGSEITFLKKAGDKQTGIWQCGINGSNLRQLAVFDRVSSPKWTSIPKITFISPSTAKVIIFVTIALTGILLLAGMALIARKAVKAVIPKIPKISKSKPALKTKGIFCTQCGKENSATASFCTTCGQKMK